MRGVLVAIDLETTGLDISTAQIIEIGAVKFQDGEIVDTYTTLIDPESPIPPKVTSITGIRPEDVVGKPKLREVLPTLSEFDGNAVIVGHNIDFDMSFLQKAGILAENISVDTYELASVLLPTTPRYNLNALMQELNLTPDGHYHRALADAQATAQVYLALWRMLMDDLPLYVLNEIVVAAHTLPWKGLPVFADALAARKTDGSEVAPIATVVTKVENGTSAILLAVVEPSTGLNTEQIMAAMDMDGPLAQAVSGYEVRPAQIEMAQGVANAFNRNENILIEATTGVGRALAYLLPSVLWATHHNERIVISINSASIREQLLSHELPLIKSALDLDFEVAVMKGRSSYLCPQRFEVLKRRLPTSVDELRVFSKVSVWLNRSQNGDSAQLSLRGPSEYGTWNRLSAAGEECALERCELQMNGVCPFYQARRAAERAHIVIADHGLLISDVVTNPAENRVLPEYTRVIVDEAHNLEDAVTQALSFRLEPTSIRRQLADLGTLKTGLLGDILQSTQSVLPSKYYDQIEEFAKGVTDAVKKMHYHIDNIFRDLYTFLETVQNLHNNDYSIQIRLTDQLRNKAAFSQVKATWSILSQFIETVADAISRLSTQLGKLQTRYEIPHMDDLLYGTQATANHLGALYKQLNATIVEPDSNTIYWMELSADLEQFAIHGAPLNVAPLVKRTIWGTKKTAVFTGSALRTGGDFNFIRQRLGASEQVREMAITQRFDYEQSLMVFLPTDMPEPQERTRYQQYVERGIIELAAATDGRLLALFTGFTQLRQAAQNIAPRLALGNITVFDQSSGTSRQSLIEGFKNSERAILLGTRSLWDDIDLAMNDLRALVIVRLPFAVPSDPIYGAKSEQYDNSFLQYTVPDAILRFRQGFDQIIRAKPTRAIATIFDKRMTSKDYGQSFLESLPQTTVRKAVMADLGATAKEWLASAPVK